jgi:hypothetical protein
MKGNGFWELLPENHVKLRKPANFQILVGELDSGA